MKKKLTIIAMLVIIALATWTLKQQGLSFKIPKIEKDNVTEREIKNEQVVINDNKVIDAKEVTRIEENQSLEKFSFISNRTQAVEIEGIEVKMNFSEIQDKEDFWIFQVAINTHSEDLSAINLAEHLEFYGNQQLKGIIDGIVEIRTGSGHHVSDQILLPKYFNELEVLTLETKEFSFLIRNLNGTNDKELVWKLN